ncbi:adenosylcobinamide-phosphate synthase CbiB [Sutcliffiella horikoshii]|uniref:adenosylcobinamide-phosphate synthase CbiB n=1 Tax=Sutcliffiella horikoshii TaxID=79883 RepID=UPI001CBF1949|nr:adenosylcobinamide-phosphate synthase CbiB [Sutcliffiella horikoshii]UAL45522.1 adenosylcobinamide-phosphate synthase CbiB [Sutcliffiella horikoshii]
MIADVFYINIFILVAAIVLDLLLGDPRWLPHPVVQMGKLISFLERFLNNGRKRKWKGVLLASMVVLFVYGFVFLIVTLSYKIHFYAGVLMEIYFIWTTIAIKGLSDAGKGVLLPLLDGKLEKARMDLSMIVGRDTENLSESEVVRGTVETIAENTVDGITAPLFWAMLGGAPLAMAYRAVNTLDSMVGYKNERFLDFGWASARLDDVANFIPARFTALSIWISSIFIKGSNGKAGWTITMRDAKKHPSPNSGWPEAMTAGLMGIQLGGVNYYKGIKSNRKTMGDFHRKLVADDIPRSILYMHGGWGVFLGLEILLLFLLGQK